ncbi:MAG: hypothetical protein MJ212_02100, partial [Alphaproteobacteria bacterium]|nr:hypothetical protein [Alphaproteobacteria bacterium]
MKSSKFIEFSVWSLLICVLFIAQYRLYGALYENADYYAQAVRVKDILTTHTWFGGLLKSANYPFGESLTGTRGIDLFWLLCSIPISGYKDIVYKIIMTGIISVVASAIIALLFFLCATTNVLSALVRAAVIIIFISQRIIYPELNFASPSALLLFPMVAVICEWWRYDYYRNQAPIVFIGIFLSIMAWFGLQGLLCSFVFILALVISWCFRKIKTDDFLVLLGIFAGLLTFFWLLDAPVGGYKIILFNRLSVFYVALAGVLFSIMGICLYLPLYTTARRFSAFLFLISVASVLAYMFFGKQIIGAIPQADEAVNTILKSRLNTDIHRKFVVLIYPMLSLLSGCYLLKTIRFNGLALMPLCALVGLIFLRFFNLVSILACVVPAVLLSALFLKMLYEKERRISILFVGYCLACVAVGSVGVLSHSVSQEKYGNLRVTRALYKDINVLTRLSKGTVLSDSLYGYPILGNTQHNVIGTTNLLNRQGIINTHAIWMSENIDMVLKLLNKHKVDYIFLPKNYDKNYFKISPENAKRFYMRIITGTG